MSLYDSIKEHPFVKEIEGSTKWVKVEPYLHREDHEKNAMLLTGSTLSGDRLISPRPLIYSQIEHRTDSSSLEYNELICIYYLGDRMCGHPGMVHGGLIATLLDESLCRCAFPLFQSRLGVTASLKIDYLSPCLVDQFIVLKLKIKTFHHRRKITVEGSIETLENHTILARAECLVVEPKSIVLGSS